MLCRSLSPECTQLKHRYDSCFNSWFEGYLQPALDASKSNFTYSSSSSSSSPITSIRAATPSSQSEQPSDPSQLVTSWANAFRPRRVPKGSASSYDEVQEDATAMKGRAQSSLKPRPIDIAGKNRAEIKAEEYERACGETWRIYQICLKVCLPDLVVVTRTEPVQRAIAANTSLSTLLEQAREEHPLHTQESTRGTPWDRTDDMRVKD